MKLIAYFSASGSTAKLAKTLAAAADAVLYEIRPETPYERRDLNWMDKKARSTVEMTPGTLVNIPANVKHWHGAAADSWFSHLAIEVSGENASNEWLEPVSDADYSKLN